MESLVKPLFIRIRSTIYNSHWLLFIERGRLLQSKELRVIYVVEEPGRVGTTGRERFRAKGAPVCST